VVPYSVRQEDERIDYDEVERLAREHKPKMIIAAPAPTRGRSISRAPPDRRRVEAILLVDMAHIAGWCRAPASQPVPVGRHRNLDHPQDAARPRAGMILCNRNSPPPSTSWFSPACKAARWCTSSPPRRSACARPWLQNLSSTRAGSGQCRALAASIQDAGFRVVSGGTDTHLMLVDVFSKGVRGKEAEKTLDRAHITVNKNAIPFDTTRR